MGTSSVRVTSREGRHQGHSGDGAEGAPRRPPLSRLGSARRKSLERSYVVKRPVAESPDKLANDFDDVIKKNASFQVNLDNLQKLRVESRCHVEASANLRVVEVKLLNTERDSMKFRL